MAALDESFHQAMLDVYTSTKTDCDHDASDYLTMVNEEGGTTGG